MLCHCPKNESLGQAQGWTVQSLRLSVENVTDGLVHLAKYKGNCWFKHASLVLSLTFVRGCTEGGLMIKANGWTYDCLSGKNISRVIEPPIPASITAMSTGSICAK